nr:hypothetical protein CFP56_64191 [Quercus suber]
MAQSQSETAQPTSGSPPADLKANKKKRKRASKPSVQTQFTIRHAPWTYIHLEHLTFSAQPFPHKIILKEPASGTDATTASLNASPSLDAPTAHLHLQAALSRFLGLHGSAIAYDILRLADAQLWMRVPAEEASALLAAVGGWVGGAGERWVVRGWSSWDARGTSRYGGQDLFGD